MLTYSNLQYTCSESYTPLSDTQYPTMTVPYNALQHAKVLPIVPACRWTLWVLPPVQQPTRPQSGPRPPSSYHPSLWLLPLRLHFSIWRNRASAEVASGWTLKGRGWGWDFQKFFIGRPDQTYLLNPSCWKLALASSTYSSPAKNSPSTNSCIGEVWEVHACKAIKGRLLVKHFLYLHPQSLQTNPNQPDIVLLELRKNCFIIFSFLETFISPGAK